MGIYLGNLQIKDIENRLGIKIEDEDVRVLEETYSQNADVTGNAWHCFDIPFMIVCGNYETAARLNDLFTKYASQMNGEFQIGWAK